MGKFDRGRRNVQRTFLRRSVSGKPWNQTFLFCPCFYRCCFLSGSLGRCTKDIPTQPALLPRQPPFTHKDHCPSPPEAWSRKFHPADLSEFFSQSHPPNTTSFLSRVQTTKSTTQASLRTHKMADRNNDQRPKRPRAESPSSSPQSPVAGQGSNSVSLPASQITSAPSQGLALRLKVDREAKRIKTANDCESLECVASVINLANLVFGKDLRQPQGGFREITR